MNKKIKTGIIVAIIGATVIGCTPTGGGEQR